MSGFVTNIEKESLRNTNFRHVLFTAKHSQLVVMHLKAKEDIGMEVHEHVDQFIRVEKGIGEAVLDGEKFTIGDGSAVVVPAGTEHDIINTSETDTMKLYTIYSPAEHPDGTIDVTKADAIKRNG